LHAGCVQDVITPANFCEDRLRGFGVARGRILAFSIDLLRPPLKHSRTTVRVCDVCVCFVLPGTVEFLPFMFWRWRSKRLIMVL